MQMISSIFIAVSIWRMRNCVQLYSLPNCGIWKQDSLRMIFYKWRRIRSDTFPRRTEIQCTWTIPVLQSGISNGVLICLGYRKCDVEQKYLSREEWKHLYEDDGSYYTVVSDVRHALRSYLQEIDKGCIFTQNFATLRDEMIAEWFHEHGFQVI